MKTDLFQSCGYYWVVWPLNCSVAFNSFPPHDCHLPGSSVHGIFQARLLEWVAISFSSRSSQPRDRTQVSHIAGRFFNSKAEVDVFLECSCFFYDPMDVGNLISGFFAFSKPSLNIWKFSGHVLLKPSLENFEHHFASVWDDCNCVVVWTFFGIAFLWDWNENWPLPVLWSLLSFSNLLAYWVQQFHSIIF